MSTITTRRARYAWAHGSTGWVPLGALTLVQGMTGAGKSTFGSWFAAGVSGGSIPGEFEGAPHRVLISSREEDPHTVVAPRLLAAGADLNNIYFSDASNLDELESEARQCRPGLVLIDPVTSFINGDRNKTHIVRPVLEKLNDLAQQLECGIVAVTHPRKGNGSDTIQEASGSLEFANVPRSVITFAADGDDRRFSQVKNSLGPLTPTFAYELADIEVQLDDGHLQPVAVFQLLAEIDGSVSDLLDNKRLTVEEIANLNRGDRSMAIIRILGMNDRALSTSEVAVAIGIEGKHATTYLARLAKGGEIVKLGRGMWASVTVARLAQAHQNKPVDSVDFVAAGDSTPIKLSTPLVGGTSESTSSTLTTGDQAPNEAVIIGPGISRKPNGALLITLCEPTQEEVEQYERDLEAELEAYSSRSKKR